MKKIAVILVSLILFTLCGCQSGAISSNEPMYPVYDISGNEIFGIPKRAWNIMILDDGYVYSLPENKDDYKVLYLDYFRYYSKNKRTVKLGFVPNYAGQSGRTAILSDNLYILAITGKRGEFKNALNLLQINLKNNTMKLISDGAIKGNVQMDNGAYCTSTITIDRSDEKHPRLLILKQNIDSDVYSPNADIVEFDPKTKKSIESGFNDIIKNTDLFTRAISIGTDSLKFLQDDTKNHSMSIKSCPFKDGGSDAENVESISAYDLYYGTNWYSSEFYVFGDYVYYFRRNGDITGWKPYFGVIENGDLQSAMDIDDNFMVASDSSQSKTEAVFYDYPTNAIYYFNLNAADGEKMKKAKFAPVDGFKINGVSKTSDGHIFISTHNPEYVNKENTKDYYIKLSDLNFENVKLLE